VTERYSHGWTDPRGLYGNEIIIRRYGREYYMEQTTSQYAQALAQAMEQTKNAIAAKIMKGAFGTKLRRYEGEQMKVDAHKYVTEAKNLPIDVCENLWITKYGNEPLRALALNEQDELMWEIGNKLFWVGKIVHDTKADTYTCK